MLSAGDPTDSKIKSLVEDMDTIILAADANRNVLILHSPKNFGGTQIHPENKVMALLGLGNQATPVKIVLNTVVADFNIFVPTIKELLACRNTIEVKALPITEDNGVVGFEGSAVFIPAPELRNAILKSNSQDPFDLIPVVTAAA
jgi:hypothetical protein